ncbi:BlaI/MecI/CopY family transcriptional regulator [Frankia sp. Cr2]|uniref:BlaI/MecI/CopY family transcriptional regulator n=1 Tax=Frankia sp. Cr2 TaxID=3073932 RepID=UPI002AD28145|nr:BlaI/MecI/CopY family transcriptional regulator [Frankia sp. Cr2]
MTTRDPWSPRRHDDSSWPENDSGQTDQTQTASGTVIRRQPGELEGAVLAVLWVARTPVSTGAIQQNLGGGLAHSTIATTLGRLIAKGHVERVRVRRVWMYHATRSREEDASARMLALLGQVADQDAALRHFVIGLSPLQVRLLWILLDAAGGDSYERDADEPAHDDHGAADGSGAGAVGEV